MSHDLEPGIDPNHHIEPCEHCGHVYTPGQPDLTQNEKNTDIGFLTSGSPNPSIVTSLAHSRIHEVLAIALTNPAVEPASRFRNHRCWAVRAAYWGNPHSSPTGDDDFSNEPFAVRKALWDRDFLAQTVRDALREEFAESGAS